MTLRGRLTTAFLVVVLGPVLVRPVIAVAGWPLRRLGPTGRLAVGVVGGTPRRAAAVSVVVALGVALVAGAAVGTASDAAIVDSTIRLGKQFGLQIIAEGVEDSPTADLLAQMGCEEGQGYYFGRPVPAEEFEERYFQSAGSVALPIQHQTVQHQ